MLACGVVAVVTLWMVTDSKLAALPKIAAWLGLFVSGAACLLLFGIGLMRNYARCLSRLGVHLW